MQSNVATDIYKNSKNLSESCQSFLNEWWTSSNSAMTSVNIMHGYFITVDYLEAKILQTMPFMNADHYDHSSLNALSCQCTRSLRLCMTSLIKQKNCCEKCCVTKHEECWLRDGLVGEELERFVINIKTLRAVTKTPKQIIMLPRMKTLAVIWKQVTVVLIL